MAEQGRRDVIQDPLAANARQQAPVRDLNVMAVKNPLKTGGQDAAYKQSLGILDAVGNLGNAVAGVMAQKQDELTAEGKLAFMQGVTEDEIAKTGNKWTMQGWQAMSAIDQANRWYANELAQIPNGGNTQNPTDYNKGLIERRAQFMAGLPDDPAIRKLYVAAFEDLGPRLTMAQTAAHNEWNMAKTVDAFGAALSSGSYTNNDAPRTSPTAPLAVSPGKVRPTVDYNDEDVDVLTRTILGEAGGEGTTGMAAVAHSILNRAIDGSFPGGRSIAGVAKAPWQYSAWNSKDKGGNDLVNADKNSAAYQNARQIAMTVLSGNNVDPTNGATFFFDPKGMKALVKSGAAKSEIPDWYADKHKEAGGDTIIGSHVFTGRARNLGTAASPSSGVLKYEAPEGYKAFLGAGEGKLKFKHPEQADLSVPMANALTNTGLQLGIDITVQSGQRDERYNAKQGGAKDSAHITGDAADISMKGMSEAQRVQLVQTLRQNGVSRFITYSNHPDMLHVDIRKGPSGEAEWFMFDKTAANMGSAPKWFQEVASTPRLAGGTNIAAGPNSAASGVANAAGMPSPGKVSVAQTQAQEFIRGIQMPADKKAKAVVQELLTQLNSGSTQLWDGIGGTGFLTEIGASADQIRLVQNAKKQYDKQQANNFSMENAEWEAEVVTKVSTGELTREEAKKQIQERFDGGKLTDQGASGLVAKVVAADVQHGKEANMDPELQRGLANVYKAIRNDPQAFNAEWGDAQVRKLAEKFEVPAAQLKEALTKVWATEENEQRQREGLIDAAHKKAVTRQAKVDEVNTAIASGYGLGAVSGEIDGQKAAQWGADARFRALAQKQAGFIDQYTQEFGGDQESAARKADAMAHKQLWTELMRHDVVYEKDAVKMTAAVTGNFIKADGRVDPSARDALDAYARLVDLDPTGAYAAKYAQNEYARNVFTHASDAIRSGLDPDEALRKAHEFMSKGLKDPPDVTQVENFNKVVSEAVKDNFSTLMSGGPNWFMRAMGAKGSMSVGDELYARTNDRQQTQLASLIKARAQVYFSSEPQNDPVVLVKKAAQDVINDSFLIGGNIITPKDTRGQNLQKQMGLEGFDRQAPDAAVKDFIRQYAEEQAELFKSTGKDPTGIGKAWSERTPSAMAKTMVRVGAGFLAPSGLGAAPFATPSDEMPPMYVSWDQDAGTMVVKLWDNEKRESTLPTTDVRPIYINLKHVGELYKNKHSSKDAGAIDDAFNLIFGKK